MYDGLDAYRLAIMLPTPGECKVPIFTIGYGARSLDAFFAVLKSQRIAYLIDVRSAPYSKFKPEFSKHALKQAATQVGLQYVYMGDVLGGQPSDPTCYDDGKVIYDRVKELPSFKKGITRLQAAHDQGLRVVVMCSEGRPEQCHRTVLIGQILTDLGIDVAHIDESDQLLTHEEALGRRLAGQLSLLDDPEFRSRKRHKGQHDAEPAEHD